MAALLRWFVVLLVVGCAGGGALYYRSHAEAARLEQLRASIDEARKHLEAGSAAKCEELLRPLLSQSKPGEESLALMALALEAQDRQDAALDLWRRLLADHPKSSWAGEARVAEAYVAIRRKDFIVAKDQFDAVTREFPGTDAAARARMGLMDIAWREGRLTEARALGTAVLDDPALIPSERARAEKLLGDISLQLLYSREPQEGDKLYSIKPGDFITKIARENNISEELLMRINNISDPRTLSVGHRIKIPTLDFRIEVDKWANTLTLYSNGQFFKKYQVRTGAAEYMTPAGEYKVLNKKKDPQWTKPGTANIIPPGHPENELGTRWMAFDGSQLGIHGTIRPETIGRYTSQGCVGLLKEDVEELFDLVAIGTPVVIKGTQNPALKGDGV